MPVEDDFQPYATPAAGIQKRSRWISRTDKNLRPYLRFAGLGIQFALVFLLFVFGGVWLDRKVGGGIPWFTLLGTLVGGAAAFYTVYAEVFLRDDDERK